VETVVNHRVIHRRHIVAGVSGGVMVAPGDLLKEVRHDKGAVQLISAKRGEVRRVARADGAWWWDGEQD
jgi:hypothetical protein